MIGETARRILLSLVSRQAAPPPLTLKLGAIPQCPRADVGYPCKTGRWTMGQETILDIDARNGCAATAPLGDRGLDFLDLCPPR
jgi:hypothetical protein